ncbi:MAG: pyrroloquinoline quinone-dependent dehydrogenase [Pseudomonadota bacterium]
MKALLMIATLAAAAAPDRSWEHVGATLAGDRYSPHTQITTANAGSLQQAWQFRTGDAADGSSHSRKSSFKATPIYVDGRLYVVSGFNRVYALEPDTGRLIWRFDPEVDFGRSYSELFTARGVAAGRGTAGKPCAVTIYLGTLDARLIALDGTTGRRCRAFGKNGEVDLSAGIRHFRRGEYALTSPPTVAGGLVIVGSSIGDNGGVEMEPGTIRAFDGRSGELRWAFDPIPKSDDHPMASRWTLTQARRTGAANVWSMAAVDETRQLAYLPTTSPAPDFFGGERLGDNRFANSLVAVDLQTGQVAWHFQTVHHDLWDYDLASQPALAHVQRSGQQRAVVLQATKMGYFFGFDRATGEPVYPVREHPVPKTQVPGEVSSPSQPMPSADLKLHPESMKLWDHSPEHRRHCEKLLKGRRYEGPFTPPSLEGTVLYPGNAGGTNWGSVAIHRERQIAVLALNRLPTVVQLVPRNEFARREANEEGGSQDVEFTAQAGTPYGMNRFNLFNPDLLLPCLRGPWGTWVAIDLQGGKRLWESAAPPFPWLADHAEASKWGSTLSGGPLITAGDLVFAASSWDRSLVAMDVSTGTSVAKIPMPAGIHASPMSYRHQGRQYVVVAAGGSREGTEMPGDFLIALALPR